MDRKYKDIEWSKWWWSSEFNRLNTRTRQKMTVELPWNIVFEWCGFHHYSFTPSGAIRMCCPFHDDRHPSFRAYTFCGRQRFRCFACGKRGDIVDFVMLTRPAANVAGLKRLLADMAEVAREHG